MNPIIVNFFESIKTFIHLFYRRILIISGKDIDFSFFVAIFLFLSIVWFLRLAIEGIEEIEKKYFNLKSAVEKNAEKAFNKTLEKEYLNQEIQNNKILMLIKIKANRLKQIELFQHKETQEEEKKEIELAALNDFFTVAQKHFPIQIKNLEDSAIMYIDNFDNFNSILLQLEKIFSTLKEEYHNQKWQIELVIGLEAYSKSTEIVSKARLLKTLLNIFSMTEIACLASFKQRYLLQKKQEYSFESMGLYKIQENEEVFTLRKIK